MVMHWTKILIGEIILLFASILIFRSVWTLLDQYLGSEHLILLLVVGVGLTLLGLFIVNYEVKCGLQKKN